jgi:hypothetical protein
VDVSLVGTGFIVLGAVVWIVCAVYAYQNAPKFGRSAWLWAIIALILGPIGLMILYVLPKRQPPAGGGDPGHKAHADPHDALYEVPKKHH